jgi:dihydroneopterin aldolase
MPVVVKLGGSLAESRTLASWLATLAEHGSGRAVIVPGGGVFADAVRAAQRQQGFSDRAAHRMAVLAMEQYAELLSDRAPTLVSAASLVALQAALAGGAVALWRPAAMVEADAGIASSWDVTSDSLAAWLARRLAAARLVLVKSAPAPEGADPQTLAALGLVDPAFPAYAAAAGCPVACCGPGETARLAALLALR